jgi:hypothetical protein
MYIISKFESFSNDSNIEEIKDIFLELVDKWDMVFEGDSGAIGYNFFIEKNDILSFHKFIMLGKEIKNIEQVYLVIYIDLTGSNDFYKTVYEFNKDCEDLLKRFQSEFNCELLTAYGNQYLQSKGIPTSRFIFVFSN